MLVAVSVFIFAVISMSLTFAAEAMRRNAAPDDFPHVRPKRRTKL